MRNNRRYSVAARIAASVFLLGVAGLFPPPLKATPNPVPLVAQPLVPDAALPGGPGFTLTVNGTGFVAGSVVTWNGSPRVTTFLGSSQLTAAILASDVAIAGTGCVAVINPSPGGGASNVVPFLVTSPTSSVFFSGPALPVGQVPQFVVAADLRADGKTDLVVANEGGSTVSVLLGNGDGTFQPSVPYATGSAPRSIAVGDFNGDGKLDLAVANTGDNTVSTLLGNGDGTFQPQTTLTVGSAPLCVVTGDFNGDGNLDLAVTNFSDSTVSILLGNGDGTFQPQATYATGADPQSLVAGDFNRDGHLDLAVTDVGPGSVSILLGNGDGTFAPHVDYNVGADPRGVVADDFNGDGKLDLAVVEEVSGAVSVLLGNGDGTFQPAVAYTAPQSPLSLTSGDFNGDGKLDLAVGSQGGVISVLLGNGDGTFQTHADQDAGSSNFSLFAADFNRDGRLDLAVADSTDVVVLLQTTAVVSPNVANLGGQLVGTTSPPFPVSLTNNGQSAFTVSGVTITGIDPSDFAQTNNCGASLGPGATCTINITFTPSTTGLRTAVANINDTAVGSPQTVTLFGTGEEPMAVLDPTTLTFGVQQVKTASAFQTASLSNFGNATLTISSITFSGDFFEENTCGSTLAPGANCFIKVRFRPRAAGTRTGVVTVTDDAPGSPQTITLTGTGTVVALSTTTVNFGSQPINTTSPPITVTLSNLGPAPLKIFAVGINGPHPVFAQTNTCGTSVPAFGNCTFSITFTPTNRRGYVETLQIKDSGGGSPQKITLIGTGT